MADLDFKIRRGLSTQLFVNGIEGNINPKLIIEEGCWYLCTDTASLFLGGTFDGKLDLRRINDIDRATVIPELQEALADLKQGLAALEDVEFFQKIDSEEDLKNIDYEADDFNPNITYYLPITEGRVSTFIFDKGIPGFVCTNSIDETVVRAMVSEAINVILDESVIDLKINEKLPEAIQKELKDNILFGGNATPDKEN